mgnify:CR=1 FL=1
MKYVILTVVIISMFSCSKGSNNNCQTINFNDKFQAKVGEKYCVNDENSMTIKSIDNQLCPCFADCFWEGEFILDLEIIAEGKQYSYQLGTSSATPDIQPFEDFKVKFLKISPDTCDFEIQKDFRVDLVLER